MNLKSLIIIAIFGCITRLVYAQPDAPTGYWSAKWIVPPDADPKAYGIYHFRKSFEISHLPSNFFIHISADQRYRLFINGKTIGLGPARSDPQHWMYDTYDLAPYLVAGKNVLAALVWNMGEQTPYAQMTSQTGFIVQGHGESEKIVNTGSTWKVYNDLAYKPVINDIAKLRTYIVVGAGDKVDASKYPWNWETKDYDDTAWPNAKNTWFAAKTRGFGSDGNWMLVARSIPMMKEELVRIPMIRRVEGLEIGNNTFIKGNNPLKVPANKKVSILLDQTHLTNAYPQLLISKGKGSTIKISYAEALMDSRRQKGHRDSILGKTLQGFDDYFMPDGGIQRMFRPLWFRTYRYVQLEIETKDESLAIDDFYGVMTGYPFNLNSSITTNDPALKKVWDVGWRTAQLCAAETYFDCPYYEQLQYTGDTRIQALISLYLTGDDRLMKKAINDYNNSRFSDGLTQSRYPCNDMQVIPPFSLFWISMIYDYWMHRQDDTWIQSLLNGMRDVIDWHEQRLGANDMNGYLDWWNFVDWVWDSGTPVGRDGSSAILTLQYVYTLQQAEKIFRYYGRPHDADHYSELAKRLAKATYSQCFDTNKGILADSPARKNFSQHANIWALLTDAIPTEKQRSVLEHVLHDTAGIVQATFYFKFYLFELLKKMNAGDEFLPLLQPWHQMIQYGLTTFAEKPEPVRSDCHAWSASPDYQLLSIVAGVNPSSPGFNQVSVKPYLGKLTDVNADIIHPQGKIHTLFKKSGTGLHAEIHLPGTLTGSFTYHQIIYPLHSGVNTYDIQ